MNKFKLIFVEIFTIMAFLLLMSYIFYCTVMGIKNDSVRDAWNLLLIIGSFVWVRSAEKVKNNQPQPEGTTTAEISATITNEPVTPTTNGS